MKGFIRLYTGKGQGKTSAAFGLALRALGAGKKVFFAQFVKGKIYSEIRAVEKYLSGIRVRQYGLDCFIVKKPSQADIDAARAGLREVREIITAGEHDLVVLDEICIAVFYKLFTVNEVLEILKGKADGTEIVMTGRYAPQEFIDAADLVTEMREIKHYYSDGVNAREGFEY